MSFWSGCKHGFPEREVQASAKVCMNQKKQMHEDGESRVGEYFIRGEMSGL
jgi:hypothetical protein